MPLFYGWPFACKNIFNDTFFTFYELLPFHLLYLWLLFLIQFCVVLLSHSCHYVIFYCPPPLSPAYNYLGIRMLQKYETYQMLGRRKSKILSNIFYKKPGCDPVMCSWLYSSICKGLCNWLINFRVMKDYKQGVSKILLFWLDRMRRKEIGMRRKVLPLSGLWM